MLGSVKLSHKDEVMTPYQVLATKVLDKAISEVFCNELNRLSLWLDPIQKTRKVEYALRQLKGLQAGIMPKYDEWVALFYIGWYQGSQINLAYSIISKMIRNGAPLNNRLHIVDFGCGALAMQFGAALAVADAIRQGQAISTIRIDLIDDSAPMIAIGREIWVAFTRGLSQYPQLTHVSQSCGKIASQEVKATSVNKCPGICWISAIHAVYDENKENLKGDLSDIVNRLAPDIWFTSTHYHSKSLLSEVCAFCYGDYTSEWMHGNIPAQFSGNLEGVTQQRKNLRSVILQQELPSDVDRDFISNYLNSSVPWKWRQAAVRLHKVRRF